LTFVLNFFYFDYLFAMVGSGPLNGTNAEHTAKLDARLHALLAAQGCHANTIGRFGELGVHSVQGLETLVDTRKDLRSFLVIGFGLDPLNGDDATKILNSLEAGKIVAAWEQAKKRVEVDNTREAERVAQSLPPQLTAEDLVVLKKKFERDHLKGKPLTDDKCPSKPYLELVVGHIESFWEAEKLTEVTSLAQAKRFAQGNKHTKSLHMDEDTLGFKLVTKPFGVPMPADSEALRARLRLMRNAHMLAKLKFPTKGVLATCSFEMWDDYIEHLFGADVWGFSIKGLDGKPMSCPHQGHVEAYDQAIREKACDLMTEGVDMETAFTRAREDMNLKNCTFLALFTTEHATQRCKALTAPAFRDINGAGSSAPSGAPKRERGEDDAGSQGQASKRQKKRERERLRKTANGKAQLALTDAPRGKGGGKRAGKQPLALKDIDRPPAGGKGGPLAGRKDLKQKTKEGKGFCYAFSNGQVCKKQNCPFAHACQICEGDHATVSCPSK
jgi:hypothetical protein